MLTSRTGADRTLPRVCRHDGRLVVCSVSKPILTVDQSDKMEIKLLHFSVISIFLSSDWGNWAEQDMTDRVSGWLGIKDGVGFVFGENRCRWVEPKRRRDGDRLP